MAGFFDSLSSFVQRIGAYRDGPLVGQTGYSKDGYRTIYGSSWIAKAAVERIPDDCFRKGYRWIADQAQIESIEEVERRHKIWDKKKRAMILSRLDGEAYIYVDDGSDSSLPLDLEAAGEIVFVNVFSAANITKGQEVKDPLSAFFGEPEYYEVNSNSSGRVRIHPSRVCRFIANPDPHSGAGRSVLEYMLSVIGAAETARDNTVALTTQARLHIMKVCGLMDAVTDPVSEASMVRRYSLFKQMIATNNMAVIDKDKEEYDSNQPTYAELPEVIETMRREVAAALDIPHAILFGREGGLGSNGDMELQTYYDTILTTQRGDLQPTTEMLDEMVIRTALGSRPDEIYYDWIPLRQMTDEQKGAIGKTIVETAGALVASGILPAEVLTEPVVNALAENGSLQGIDQAYADWVAGGGLEEQEEEDEENDENGS